MLLDILYTLIDPNTYVPNKYILKCNFHIFEDPHFWNIPKPIFYYKKENSYIDFELEVFYINILKLK